jgi:hypothetical protein
LSIPLRKVRPGPSVLTTVVVPLVAVGLMFETVIV